MNINRYALREERKIQKIISKMGHIDATAIGMCKAPHRPRKRHQSHNWYRKGYQQHVQLQ